MDRQEKPRRRRGFANQGLDEGDAQALGTLTGREPHRLKERTQASEDQPVGASRRSDVTGRHDNGDETIDGLTGSEEAARRQAEDVPLASEPEDDDEAAELAEEGAEETPVFDEASQPPRS